MNSWSAVSIFAVVFAVNLFLFGALLAGGLAVVLRFTENAAPRLRYLAAIIVFLMAIFVPLTATIPANSAGPKDVTVFGESESDRRSGSEDAMPPRRVLTAKTAATVAAAALPPTSKINKSFVNDFVLIVTTSLAGKMFCGIWLLGSFLLGLRALIGIRQLELSKKHWIRANASEQADLLCPLNIPLYFAEDQTPGTSGWLRPTIVLPGEFPLWD